MLDRNISPRMILELEFKLPGSGEELITTYAEVIWQSNSHTGIKFISYCHFTITESTLYEPNDPIPPSNKFRSAPIREAKSLFLA